jgi:hypothetical protein
MKTQTFWYRIIVKNSKNPDQVMVKKIGSKYYLTDKCFGWDSAMTNGISVHEKVLLSNMSPADYCTPPFSLRTDTTIKLYGCVEIVTDKSDEIYFKIIEDFLGDDPCEIRRLAHHLLVCSPTHKQKPSRETRTMLRRRASIKYLGD